MDGETCKEVCNSTLKRVAADVKSPVKAQRCDNACSSHFQVYLTQIPYHEEVRS